MSDPNDMAYDNTPLSSDPLTVADLIRALSKLEPDIKIVHFTANTALAGTVLTAEKVKEWKWMGTTEFEGETVLFTEHDHAPHTWTPLDFTGEP